MVNGGAGTATLRSEEPSRPTDYFFSMRTMEQRHQRNNVKASVFDTSREPLVSATGEEEGPVLATSTSNEVSGLNPCNGGSETDVSGKSTCVKMSDYRHVQTLHETGKVDNVIREMNRCSISLLGIAEARCTGCGHFTAASGELVIYSGGDTHRSCFDIG